MAGGGRGAIMGAYTLANEIIRCFTMTFLHILMARVTDDPSGKVIRIAKVLVV